MRGYYSWSTTILVPTGHGPPITASLFRYPSRYYRLTLRKGVLALPPCLIWRRPWQYSLGKKTHAGWVWVREGGHPRPLPRTRPIPSQEGDVDQFRTLKLAARTAAFTMWKENRR